MKFLKSHLSASISVVVGLSVPMMALALDFNLAESSFSGIVDYALSILNVLIPILFSAAFIVFFWGLSKFILNGSGNQAELKKGKDYMMWGILALFILLTFRTIISLIATEFELGDGKTIPQLPSSSANVSSEIQVTLPDGSPYTLPQ